MIEYRHTAPADRSALTELWREAFGDDREFIDGFFRTAYAPERSLGAFREGRPAGMLYWFDCALGTDRIAYVYAVATAEAFRGQGIATALMERLHRLLRERGYAGAVLCPGSGELFRFYGRMGYANGGARRERRWDAGAPVDIIALSREEYALLRASMLPEGGIRQEGENLAFLELWCRFYAGQDFCAAVSREGSYCPEYLGDEKRIPGLLGALGMEQARVRTPGEESPCVMIRSFGERTPERVYLGFPFD